MFLTFLEVLEGFGPQKRILREKLVLELAGKVWKPSIWSTNSKKTSQREFVKF